MNRAAQALMPPLHFTNRTSCSESSLQTAAYRMSLLHSFQPADIVSVEAYVREHRDLSHNEVGRDGRPPRAIGCDVRLWHSWRSLSALNFGCDDKSIRSAEQRTWLANRQRLARKRQFFSVFCNWGILPPSYPRDVPDSHGRKANVHAAGERQTAAEP